LPNQGEYAQQRARAKNGHLGRKNAILWTSSDLLPQSGTIFGPVLLYSMKLVAGSVLLYFGRTFGLSLTTNSAISSVGCYLFFSAMREPPALFSVQIKFKYGSKSPHLHGGSQRGELSPKSVQVKVYLGRVTHSVRVWGYFSQFQ
jgi:hypothetical protein